MWNRLAYFLTPWDGRYEDLRRGNVALNVFRDFTAGLIVAMIAIPLAMGFAMASGLEPEQGIVGGAVAGLIGALFGGSKYQVYGPTAAFIPVILSLMLMFPDDHAAGHGFLVLASIISGVILAGMGLARLGRFVAQVPHSIVVGFTIGIAVVIVSSQMGSIFGLEGKGSPKFLDQIRRISGNIGQVNGYALALALGTFALTKGLLKVSIYFPAPLLALGIGGLVAGTVWADKGLITIGDMYGAIPTDFSKFTPPALPAMDAALWGNLAYFVAAIVFVAAIESLLCSRMADRLAENHGQPFNPNKELWGQGMVNVIVPLFNGFPHTGALARTATNIKVGAVSPLAGICKFALKLSIAAFLARWLEQVPMACVGGIMLFVAVGMVKPAEVRSILEHGRFQTVLMAFTAIMVIVTDFLIGVLSGMVLWGFAHVYVRLRHRQAVKAREETAAAGR